ncbi:response regulator [Aidingimonas lacisalsi]|uniref:response regulator n=1 Tax=Aidingimonas lacisalsi TaxID=2604086 RepID=UPI0011D1CC29|nr:response regulator [Aidingimonas lacisalsi]
MSLKSRLIALLLGLPLAAAILVAALAIFNDIQQRRSALSESLISNADILAPSLSAILARHDSDDLAPTEALQTELRPLAKRLLNIDDVQSVSLRTGDGETLLQLGQHPARPAASVPESTRLETDGPPWRLDMPLATQDDAPPVWLEMEADTVALALGTYHFLSLMGLVFLITAVPIAIFVYLFSRRISRFITSLHQALARLYTDEPFTPLDASGPAELAELSTKINALARRQQDAKEDTQRHIEQTTQELQESMETIEIQNIELDMAHRRALDANQIKSEFLANISHEIRTPLNGIIGFCQLLDRSRLEARQRDWLGHVQNASESLLSLINDILDFSKLEAGKLELESVTLDMVTLVDDVLGLQAPQAHEKDLHLLGLVYDDVPAQLQGDPLRIKQVLTNLVHNAIKFTQQGDIIVRVMLEDIQERSSMTEKEGDETTWRVVLKVTVSDTGIGLSPDYHQRLFKAFSQASISDTRQYGGTGLGLKICRQLLEQMGGDIDVDSQPGKGSTFSFTLPLQATSLDERAPEMVLDDALIVLQESHPPTRRALTHLLSHWGARVTSPAALQHDDSPALCIMNLHDRQHENRSLGTQESDIPQCATCPTLILLNASPVDTRDASLADASDVLTKPLSRRTLADSIQRLLTAGPQQAHDTTTTDASPLSDARRTRVLIVDDSASNRLLIHETLKGLGIETLLATSGEEAIALAQEQDADLVLMDIRMEGMDGVETLRSLRRLTGRWRHCPVIAVTAHALEDERRRLLNVGMHDVLIKPIQIDDLMRMLNDYLGLDKDSEPASQPQPVPDRTVTATSNDLAIVDHEMGIRLAGGNASLAVTMLDQLVAELDESEPALAYAREHGDRDTLLDIVHQLNGACRYCGVPRLALLAETLETRLRVNGSADIDDLLDALFRAMAELRSWQTSHRTSLPDAGDQDSSTTTADARSFSSDNDT